MAKADVTLKVDAQTAEAYAQFQKMRDAILDTADKTRHLGEAGGKAGEEMSKAFKEVAGELVGITSITGAVIAGIELVKGTAENLLARTEERAKLFVDRALSLNQALAASGQGGSAESVRQQIAGMSAQNIGGRHFSQGDLTHRFAGISGALGPRAGVDEKLQATRIGSEAEAGGLAAIAADQVGINFARLKAAGISGTDEELQDLAMTAQVYMPGGLDPKSLEFLARAPDKKQAMQMLFAAAQSDEGGKGLIALQNLSRGDPVRMQRILDNPTMAPLQDRLAIANLKRGMGQVRSFPLHGAEPHDQASQTVRGMETVEDINKATAELTGPEDAKTEYIRAARRAYFQREHPTLSAVPGFSWLAGFGESTPERNAGRIPGKSHGSRPLSEDETINVLHQMLDQLKAGNSGGEFLQNGSEGQK